MKIRWERVLIAICLVTGIVLLVRNSQSIGAFFSTATGFPKARTPDEFAIGAMCFTLIVVSVLAALRIALNSSDRNQP